MRVDDQRARSLPCLLAVLVWLAGVAPGGGQGCPEPSAVDRVPGATPLEVTEPQRGRMIVSWQAVGADDFRLLRGNLPSLWSDVGYDHVQVAVSDTSSILMLRPPDDHYYLAVATCRGNTSSAGRDSDDNERPVARMAEFTVRVLTASSAIFAVQVKVDYSASEAVMENVLLEQVGPYTRGADGAPLVEVNDDESTQEVLMAAAFQDQVPDPSFPAPADLLKITFGYFGDEPQVSDFSITECFLHDTVDTELEGTCGITGFQLLD